MWHRDFLDVPGTPTDAPAGPEPYEETTIMTTKRTWRALVAAAAMLALPAAASAQSSVLYEVTENMYFYDGAGRLIPPDLILGGLVSPSSRVADATLQGTASLGTPLCPSKLLVTNPKAKTCTVTAAGMDNISLKTGKGTVRGTYAVVINLDNQTDAPEYVVQTGTFSGDMDLSMRPLGSVKGTFTPSGTIAGVPFTGTFRLPFNMDSRGKRDEPKRHKQAFYLADDGKSVIAVQTSELSLGMPLVRLELSF
jgi:hypothetical protein